MIANKFLLSRRQALISIAGFTGGIVLTNCANDKNSETLSLGARFADGYQAPTVFTNSPRQRAPYTLIGEEGFPITENVPNSIDLFVTEVSTGETIYEGEISRHGESGVIPYFPLIFNPSRPGEYKVEGKNLTENLEEIEGIMSFAGLEEEESWRDRGSGRNRLYLRK